MEKAVAELTDIITTEVSLVDRAANKRAILIKKNAGGVRINPLLTSDAELVAKDVEDGDRAGGATAAVATPGIDGDKKSPSRCPKCSTVPTKEEAEKGICSGCGGKITKDGDNVAAGSMFEKGPAADAAVESVGKGKDAKKDNASADTEGEKVGDEDVEKAKWTKAEMDKLPDSAFLYVEAGGKKDEEGKTVPRSNRHFPVKGPDGKPDPAHVRNALARIPQSSLSQDVKDKCKAKAERMLGSVKKDDAGQSVAESDDGSDLPLVIVVQVDPPAPAVIKGKISPRLRGAIESGLVYFETQIAAARAVLATYEADASGALNSYIPWEVCQPISSIDAMADYLQTIGGRDWELEAILDEGSEGSEVAKSGAVMSSARRQKFVETHKAMGESLKSMTKCYKAFGVHIKDVEPKAAELVEKATPVVVVSAPIVTPVVSAPVVKEDAQLRKAVEDLQKIVSQQAVQLEKARTVRPPNAISIAQGGRVNDTINVDTAWPMDLASPTGSKAGRNF